MAIDLYSYSACLGTLVIDWINKTTTFAGMDGNIGGDEMTVEQVQATLAEHAGSFGTTAWGLIFWLENEQLAVHDAAGFAAEVERDRGIKSEEEPCPESP